jgi:hypothetical protein
MKRKAIVSILTGTLVIVAAVGVCAFNTSKNATSKNGALSLQNVKATQASATEYTCDATNSNTCTITAEGHTGTGTGRLIAQ